MAKSKNKSSGKVDDVSQPGMTPASSNARPTITGHQPVIKNDPMVSSSKDDEENPATKVEKKQSFLNKTKIKINPISDDLKNDDKEKTKQSDEPKEETTEDNQEDATEKEPDTREDKVNDNSDSAAIDALAKTADSKKAESKQAEEEQKHREYIDGLAKSGKYRLPIIEGGHKGSAERIVSWIFLLLLLASIGVYLAIDAGYVDVGFGLPIEFIQN